MATYYLTIYHYNEIADRVPHDVPEFYEEEGILCVKVRMQEDTFQLVTERLGW